MPRSTPDLKGLVETMRSRIEELEKRCDRLEEKQTRGVGRSAAETSPPTSGSVALDSLNAVNEYYRREQLAYYRPRPDALAAARKEGAKINAFLAERGLPARVDPYPELPGDASAPRDAVGPSLTIDELADKVKALGLRTRADSVQIIRSLRDGRQGGPRIKRAR